MKLFQGFGGFAAAGAPAVNAAWELLTPSSITTSSGTATIESDGSITLTSVEILTVNGVFSATYRNYYIMQNTKTASDGAGPQLKMAASGVIDAATTYSVQRIEANNSTRSAARATSTQHFSVTGSSSTTKQMNVHWLGDPYGAFRTTWECQVLRDPSSTLRWHRRVGIKDTTTQYDGFAFNESGGLLITGKISVYGVKGG